MNPAYTRWHLTPTLILLLSALGPASFGSASAGGAARSAAEAGARFGQATAAARFCPAGIVTEKGKALAQAYSGADAETFKAEADKVMTAWSAAAECNELRMDSRELAFCRTAKLRSCRAAWAEIGPEGSAMPGLLDIKIDQ